MVNLKERNDYVICHLEAFLQSSDSQLILLHSGFIIFLLWFNERCQLCRVSLLLSRQCERREFLGTNSNKLGAYTIVHKGYQKNSPREQAKSQCANPQMGRVFVVFPCTHYVFRHNAPNVVRSILVTCTCVSR